MGALIVAMATRPDAPEPRATVAPVAEPAAAPPADVEEDAVWTPPTPASLTGQPIITRVDNAHRRIAITFDACATRTHGYGFDRAVYEILQREKVPVTIFTSGRWVEFHPDVMADLEGDPLVEFGNHSYDHPHMSRLDSAHISAQIDQTEAALGRYGKRSVAFRPPFGDIDAHVVDVVHQRGLPVVTWDVVSGDPSAATTTRGMIEEVDSKTRPGSIVIFHINGRGRKTAQALPTILHDLRERGFQFVHLSALLASRGAGAGETGGRTSHDAGRLSGAAMCEPPAPWDHIEPSSSTGEEIRCP